MDDEYLITTKLCGNAWRIVWATPTRVLLKGTTQLTIYALLIALGACVVFMLIGMLIIDRITRPMDGMVSDLAVMADVDQLAGVLNKITFQNKVERRAGAYENDRCLVYIMMDADNFKQINDRLGHAYGDQVIIRIAQVLKQIFEGNALIGRVGGDEFSIFMETPNSTRADAMQHAANYMDRVYAAYAQEFAKERAACGLSLSAGVCVMRDEAGMDFDKLYRRADAALYYSKRGGKNRYTLYREDMGDEQAANQ
jgi:diguanylate cyclase (GGDEF)-like protein